MARLRSMSGNELFDRARQHVIARVDAFRCRRGHDLVGELPEELRSLGHGGTAGAHVLRLRGYDDVEQTLATVRRAGCRIEEMELMQPDLEDVFVDVMQRS